MSLYIGSEMHRQMITRTQYLAELNNRLRSHPAYVHGMKFAPSGSDDPETAAEFEWVSTGHNAKTAAPYPFAEIPAPPYTRCIAWKAFSTLYPGRPIDSAPGIGLSCSGSVVA